MFKSTKLYHLKFKGVTTTSKFAKIFLIIMYLFSGLSQEIFGYK